MDLKGTEAFFFSYEKILNCNISVLILNYFFDNIDLGYGLRSSVLYSI